jgi:hypothetical protein
MPCCRYCLCTNVQAVRSPCGNWNKCKGVTAEDKGCSTPFNTEHSCTTCAGFVRGLCARCCSAAKLQSLRSLSGTRRSSNTDAPSSWEKPRNLWRIPNDFFQWALRKAKKHSEVGSFLEPVWKTVKTLRHLFGDCEEPMRTLWGACACTEPLRSLFGACAGPVRSLRGACVEPVQAPQPARRLPET